MTYTYPLVATHRDGHTELFYTAHDAGHFFRTHTLGHQHYERVHEARFINGLTHYVARYKIYDWILRDDRGREVMHADIAPNYVEPKTAWTRRCALAQKAINTYGQSVPHLRKRKRWKKHHQGAMILGHQKADIALEEAFDDGFVVRARQNDVEVDRWGDDHRRPDHSWKRHRRTRWK